MSIDGDGAALVCAGAGSAQRGRLNNWAPANVAIKTIAIRAMKFLVAAPREQIVAGGGASLFGSLSVVLIAVLPSLLNFTKCQRFSRWVRCLSLQTTLRF